jgi:hypothetical protein
MGLEYVKEMLAYHVLTLRRGCAQITISPSKNKKVGIENQMEPRRAFKQNAIVG